MSENPSLSDDAQWPNWQHLGPLELLMLEGSNPNNPVVITTILSFAEILSMEWMKQNLLARLTLHPRFRSTVQLPKFRRPFFSLVDDCDKLQELICEEHLSSSGSCQDRQAAFNERINEIVSRPLPFTQPLWRVYFFPNFGFDTPRNHGCTVVLRIHHVLGDGVALVKYCASYVADKSEMGIGLPQPHRQRPSKKTASVSFRAAVVFFALVVQLLWYAFVDVLLVFVGTFLPDSNNVFNATEIDVPKFALFVPPSRIPLQQVKRLAKALKVTVNDILLTALAGALREYMLRHGSRPDGAFPKRFHAALAFNQHTVLADGANLRNKVVLIPVKVPVHEPNQRNRLLLVTQTTKRIKAGFIPALFGPALVLLCLLPRWPRSALWRHMTRRVSCVWTNIPGPTHRLQIAGIPVESVSVAAPGDGEGSSIFTMFSYNGFVGFCVSGDPNRVAFPEELSDLLLLELDHLSGLTLSQ